MDELIEQYPIIDLTIHLPGRDLPLRFAIEPDGHGKGPEINGRRGHISAITMERHMAGAHFTVYVTNDGIQRPWKELGAIVYTVKRDIKGEL